MTNTSTTIREVALALKVGIEACYTNPEEQCGKILDELRDLQMSLDGDPSAPAVEILEDLESELEDLVDFGRQLEDLR